MPGTYTFTLDENKNGFDYSTGDPWEPTKHIDPGQTTPELNACQFMSAVDAAIAANPGSGSIDGIDMDKVQEECYSTTVTFNPSDDGGSPPTETDPTPAGEDSAFQQGAPAPSVLGKVVSKIPPVEEPLPTEEPRRPDPGIAHPTHKGEQPLKITTAGDPINLFTGALTLQETDLTIPNTLLPMMLTRFYQSGAPSFGPFGWNWDHNFNVFIRQLNNGDLALWRNSNEEHYKWNGNSYDPPRGVFQKLERVTGQIFEILGAGGFVMHFGQPINWTDAERIPLTWLKDANGNKINFTYGSEDKLAEVRDDNDCFFHFNYDECGLIVSVSDHAGRTFRYEHDEETMQLVSATSPATTDHPDGISFAYHYESLYAPPDLRHNILRIEDGDGNIFLENTYEQNPASWSFARITGQLFGGYHFQFRYTHLQWVPSNAKFMNIPALRVEALNPDGGLETHTFNYRGDLLDHRLRLNKDKSFRVTVHQYKFDEQGNLVKTTRPDGSEEIIIYDVSNQDPRMRNKVLQTEITAASGFPAPSRITWQGKYEDRYQQLVEEKNETGATTRYRYDFDITPQANTNSGKLIEIIQPDATLPDGTIQTAKTIFEYNNKGQLTASISPTGVRNEIFYGTIGAQKDRATRQIFDSGGLDIQHSCDYDLFGFRTKLTDGNGNSTHHFYNALGLVERIKLPMINGSTIEYFYHFNSDKKIIKVERPKGAYTESLIPGDHIHDSCERNVLGHPILCTINSNTNEQRVIRYKTDFRGTSLETTYPTGIRIKKTIDERGLQVSEVTIGKDNKKITSSKFYDRAGKLLKEINTQGVATEYEYDGFGRINKTKYSNGTIKHNHWLPGDRLSNEEMIGDDGSGTIRQLSARSFSYDEKGRMIYETITAFVTDPSLSIPLTKIFFYDEMDRIVKIINCRGSKYTKQYDGLGRILREEDPSGNQVRYRYDLNGNLIRIEQHSQQPNNTVVMSFKEFTYDARNRQISCIEPDGATINNVYDDRDMIISQTDYLGIRKEIFYNAANNRIRLIEDAEGINSTHQWTIDSIARIIRYEDPTGQLTNYFYDSLDRPFRNEYANGSLLEKEYNDKNLVSIIRTNNGTEHQHSYDAHGRLIKIENTFASSPLMPLQTHKFRFDGLDRMVEATTGTNTIIRQFDSQNRLVEERTEGVALTCSYDDISGKVEKRWPDGRTEIHTHNPDGSLLKIEQLPNAMLGSNIPVIASFQSSGPFDAGRIDLHAGVIIENTYDERRRLTDLSISSPVGVDEKISYRYDTAGSRQVESMLGQNPTIHFFAFDKMYRLVQSKDQFNSLILQAFSQWEHDNAISIVKQSSQVAAHEESFQYNASDARTKKQETALPDSNYTYFNGHKMQSDGTNNYSYFANGTLQSDDSFQYKCDSYGRIVSILSGTTVIAEINFDALGRPCRIKELNRPEVTLHYFGQNVLQENHNGIAAKQITINPRSGFQLCYHSDSGTRYLIIDERMNLVGLIDDNGSLVETYRYKAFGAPQIFDANNNPVGVSAFNQTPIFGGQRYLPSCGLYLSTRRLMDPQHGIFLSPDPKEYIDSPSLYAYVSQNPIHFYDATGEEKMNTSLDKVAKTDDGWTILDNPIWNTITHNGVGLTATILEEGYEVSSAIPGFVNIWKKIAQSNNRWIQSLGSKAWNVANAMDDAILYPANRFPKLFGKPFYQRIPFTSKVNAFLAPLGMISDSISLYEALKNKENKPGYERWPNVVASGSGLFSSTMGTTALAGHLLKVGGIRGGQQLLWFVGTKLISRASLLAAGFAGGYAIGSTIRAHTGWGDESAKVGGAVTNFMLQYDSFLPDFIDTGASYFTGLAITAGGTLFVEPTAWVASKIDDAVMPEGRTLNPIVGIKSILRWENPFW